MQFSARDLQRLEGVHPDLVRVVRRAAAITEMPFTVLEGLRTRERQAELLRKGATRTLRSRHLTGHAVDLAPLNDIDGDGDLDVSWRWPHYFALERFVKSAAVLEGVQIEWGGDWREFKDGPHWQLPWKAYP
jgi:peptidoglycan L-alanyl-D-glutamate endopeptidase CwlK